MISPRATTKALYVVLDCAGCVSLYWAASRGEATKEATKYITEGEYGADEYGMQMIRCTMYRVPAGMQTHAQERGI